MQFDCWLVPLLKLCVIHYLIKSFFAHISFNGHVTQDGEFEKINWLVNESNNGAKRSLRREPSRPGEGRGAVRGGRRSVNASIEEGGIRGRQMFDDS